MLNDKKAITFNLLRLRIAGVLAVGAMLVVSWLLKSYEISAPLRLILALLPVLPFALWSISYVQWIRQMDELQQRIQLEALAMAFPTAILFAFVFEYLQKAELIPAWFHNPILLNVWPSMIVLYLVAYWLTNRRYR